MKPKPSWFSRAGLRSGPPVSRLVEELDKIRTYEGYPFWERLQLWIETHTPLCPALVQVQRRWSMMLHPMRGRPIEVSLDEDGNIRMVECAFNHRQTVLKTELDTRRGRQIFVAEVLEVAQLPVKVHAARSKRRHDAAGDGRPTSRARRHVFGRTSERSSASAAAGA